MWPLGIVTRCPLVLKLKKLRPEEEWRGKVSYLDIEEDISDASKVEEEIRKGKCPVCLVVCRMPVPAAQCGLWMVSTIPSLAHPVLSKPLLWAPAALLLSCLSPLKDRAWAQNLASGSDCGACKEISENDVSLKFKACLQTQCSATHIQGPVDSVDHGSEARGCGCEQRDCCLAASSKGLPEGCDTLIPTRTCGPCPQESVYMCVVTVT